MTFKIQNISPENMKANTLLCRERNLPSVIGLNTGRHWSVVAGGPSMRGCTPSADIVTINGAHDALIARGIIPQFCLLLDTLPHIASIITPHKDVTYLVASQCPPELFDKLENYDVRVWHAAIKDNDHFLPSEEPLVSGGAQTALRTLNLGYILGVREWDYYGLDSSYEDEQHGYDSPHDLGTPGPENHMVRYDGWDGLRHFKSSLPMMVQATEFMKWIRIWRTHCQNGDMDMIYLNIHGEGLIPYIWQSMVERGKHG